MARPRRNPDPFASFVEQLAEAIAMRLGGKAGAPANGKRRGPATGRMLDMSCRYPACKNRSKGPRFRFLCEEHLKLPKAQQNAVLAKWAEKNS
jgi:hypothetical protein